MDWPKILLYKLGICNLVVLEQTPVLGSRRHIRILRKTPPIYRSVPNAIGSAVDEYGLDKVILMPDFRIRGSDTRWQWYPIVEVQDAGPRSFDLVEYLREVTERQRKAEEN